MSDGAFLGESTAVRFPNNVPLDKLSEDAKQFVCSSANLETTFQELDKDRNSNYGIAFIGNIDGGIRSYPSTRRNDENGNCKDYDPRFRPWYVSATSGSKNVIVIIDKSGSMNGTRIELAKEAAKSVVETLSNSDFVGVVAFSSEADTIGNGQIVRASTENKEEILGKIDEITATGNTNYERALKKAVSMLEKAEKDEFGSPCEQDVILFLTDGDPSSGIEDEPGLTSILKSSTRKKITLFTYGLAIQE